VGQRDSTPAHWCIFRQRLLEAGKSDLALRAVLGALGVHYKGSLYFKLSKNLLKAIPRAVSDPMCKSALVRRAADYLCGVSAMPGATREDEVESMQPGSTARSLVAPACRGVHSIHRSRKSRKLLLFQMSREIITAHSYCLLRFRDSLLWTGGTVF
jgi:hypothetical protein